MRLITYKDASAEMRELVPRSVNQCLDMRTEFTILTPAIC
jgi:hypothetical protein